MRIGGRPASRQARDWRQASCRTHRPIARNEPGFFGNRHELCRRHEPALRVTPADESLDAGELPRVQAHYRLIVQHEFVTFDGAVQSAFEGLPIGRVPVHLRLEEPIVVAPTVLGVVHREIRMLQQCLGLRAVIGVGDDSNACGEMQILLVDAMRRAQGEEYFLGGDGRIRRLGHFGEQDHEFIASLPADGVRAAYAGKQPLCHGLQQAVADGVTEGIVDALEAIQVQE